MLLPATCETGVEHDRLASPSTCTVHAPHSPAPQPNFVPVSSSVSRRTQSKGVSGETLTFFSLPFTRSAMSAMFVLGWLGNQDNMVLNRRKNGNGQRAREFVTAETTCSAGILPAVPRACPAPVEGASRPWSGGRGRATDSRRDS